MNLFEKNKQKWIVGGVILGLLLLAAGLGIFSYVYGNRCYHQYQVQSKVDRSDSNNVKYMYYEGNILKYSRSGISEIDNAGKSLWNGGDFGMEGSLICTIALTCGIIFLYTRKNKDAVEA